MAMSSFGVSVHPGRGCEMGGGWRGILEAGLGDSRTRVLGVFLILVAVIGTLLLRSYANIETVFAASLLAGSLLGRWWTILVPLTALAVLQPLEWSTTYTGYGLNAITGITFFVISGYVFVGFLGRRIRPRVLFRVKSVALLTTISVPVTIAYDLWTAIGEWYFFSRIRRTSSRRRSRSASCVRIARSRFCRRVFKVSNSRLRACRRSRSRSVVLSLPLMSAAAARTFPLPDEGFPLFREGPGNE